MRRDAAVRVAVQGLALVREQRRHVQAQHDDPDERDQQDHVTTGAVRLARVAAREKETVISTMAEKGSCCCVLNMTAQWSDDAMTWNDGAIRRLDGMER